MSKLVKRCCIKRTHLHKIDSSVFIGALNSDPVAPCPGGGAMCLYLDRVGKKTDLCHRKASIIPESMNCNSRGNR